MFFKSKKLDKLETAFQQVKMLQEQQAITIENLTEAIATQKEREELIEQYKKAGGRIDYKAPTDTPSIYYKQISIWGIYRLAGVQEPEPDKELRHTIADFKNILNEQIAKQHKEKCKPKGKGK